MILITILVFFERSYVVLHSKFHAHMQSSIAMMGGITMMGGSFAPKLFNAKKAQFG